MQEVVGQVIRANNRIAAARYMERSAEANIGAAAAWPDPMLMLGLENAPTNFDLDMDPMTMKMIGISQEIPYAGYLGLQRRAARAEAEAAAAERRTTAVDLATAAKLAYIDLYFKQRNLQDLNRQRELLDQVITSATAKLRANQATQDEVLAAQADLWRLESMILSLEQEIDAARINLNSLRGVDAGTSIPPLAPPDFPPVPDSPSALIESANSHYPALAQLERQAESFRLSGAASRRMVWPMLALEAEYGFRSGFDMGLHGEEEPRDNMVSLRANISLPIFSGGQQRSMARSMEAMSQSTTAEAAQLRRDIEAAIVSLHQRAQRLSQSLNLYQNRIIPAAEDAYRSALAGYTANRTPLTTLLNYEVNIYRDRITVTQLAMDLTRTLAEIERYTTNATQWDDISEDD